MSSQASAATAIFPLYPSTLRWLGSSDPFSEAQTPEGGVAISPNATASANSVDPIDLTDDPPIVSSRPANQPTVATASA
jgi:hypothetical protein